MVDDLQSLCFLVEVAENRVAVEEDRAVDAGAERALTTKANFAVGRVDADVGIAVEETVLGVVEGAVVQVEPGLEVEDDLAAVPEIFGTDDAYARSFGDARVHGDGRVAAVGMRVVQARVKDAVDVNGRGVSAHGGEGCGGHGRNGKKTKRHDESPFVGLVLSVLGQCQP